MVMEIYGDGHGGYSDGDGELRSWEVTYIYLDGEIMILDINRSSHLGCHWCYS